ncbi:hypothetical protein B0H16DRAFT_1720145 [Mycena metata]|uniref:Uncharacterized protein n=1 Tax=Mycena metata TaxID=1033252 RepID=A0AAD7NH90_9AGAR|nr:hypothetical protein B0H16DRAFT_1720145 [Mycena metata]
MARSGQTAPSPHATRNVGHQVQLGRRRPGMSRAHRASQALRLAGPRRKKREFDDDIDLEFKRRATELARMALQHSKDIPYIRNILASVSQYKASKIPSLHHAVVHQRWLDLQADGKTQTLHEIKRELKEDIESGEFDMEAIDVNEKERLVTQVLNHRMLKRRGVRSTTRSVELDVKQTASRIGDALIDLHFRTGVRGFALVSRGHADDPSKPHFVDSDDAMAYLMEVYGISPYDFLRSFEAWSCTRDNGIVDKNDLGSMRSLVSTLLTDSLRRIKHNNTLSMDYVNYDVAIREGKGVELAGWPADVPMTRPAMWNVETVRRVRDSLRSGAIHWELIPRARHAELIAANNAKRAAEGSGALRKRAVRSDSGTKRGPNRRTGKKKKTAAANDDDDEEEEEEEEDTAPLIPPQTISAPAPVRGNEAPNPFPSLPNGAAAATTHTSYPSLHYDPDHHVPAAPDLDALLALPSMLALPPLDPSFDIDGVEDAINAFLASGAFPEAGTLGEQGFANDSVAPTPLNGAPTPAFIPVPPPTQFLETALATASAAAALPSNSFTTPAVVTPVPPPTRLGVSSRMNITDGGAANPQDNAAPPTKRRKVRSDAGVPRKTKVPQVGQNNASSPPPRKRKVRSDAGKRKK